MTVISMRMNVHADFTSTSELPFASFSERVLVPNVSHENDLIFYFPKNRAEVYYVRLNFKVSKLVY